MRSDLINRPMALELKHLGPEGLEVVHAEIVLAGQGFGGDDVGHHLLVQRVDDRPVQPFGDGSHRLAVGAREGIQRGRTPGGRDHNEHFVKNFTKSFVLEAHFTHAKWAARSGPPYPKSRLATQR